MTKKKIVPLLITSVATAIVVVGLIYATPLHGLGFIDPQPKDIDAAQFWSDYQKDPSHYVFIDVRDPSVYKTAHAKGAQSMPIGTLYDGKAALPKSGKTIVLICSSGRLAGVAYGFLEDHGFHNLLRISGGLASWVVESLPVEGANPKAPVPTMDY